MEKVDVLTVLKNSFDLYRKNFKGLSVFSLIYVLLLIGMPVLNFISARISDALWLWIMLSYIVLLGILLVVLMPKLQLGIQIYIADAIKGKVPNVKNSFAQTKGKVLRLIGNELLAILLIAIPGLIIISLFGFLTHPYSFLFAMLSGLLLSSAIHMLVPVVALEDSAGGKLKRAFVLIKGNFTRVLIIVFFTDRVFTIPNTILSRTVFEGNILAIFIIATATNILTIFTFAFSSVVQGVLYQQLRRSKSHA